MLFQILKDDAVKELHSICQQNLDNSAVATGLEKVSFHSSLCPTLVTLWMVACQSPLSKGVSRQNYWSGLPFPSPGDLPNPGIKPRFPALQADSLPTELHGKSFPIPEKGNAKECSNYCTTALISHASKVILKILQAVSTVCVPRTSRCSSWT